LQPDCIEAATFGFSSPPVAGGCDRDWKRLHRYSPSCAKVVRDTVALVGASDRVGRSNPAVASLSCGLNRSSAGNPLFLVNYWLNDVRSLATDARRINAYDMMRPYVQRCRNERGRLPNYVAVNFYDQGDVFRVVERLNGFG
jgi:hypothetical protein